MITFEIAKNNALEEINDLTKTKIKNELSSFKIENIDKIEEVINKILDNQISPIFEEVINKNKTNINNKIEEYKNLKDDEIQYKINEFINSSLSIWKQTVLNAKIIFVIKEVITYIKLVNNTETNYKKQEKQIKKLKKIEKKYNI